MKCQQAMRTFRFVFTLLAGLALNVIVAQPASAQTESVLYNFCQMTNCSDGLEPTGNIVRDSKGNTYGTTLAGGQFGQGVLYSVSPSGVETVLHNFGSSTYDGQVPTGLVSDSDGNLYGTTQAGGSHVSGSSSFGTVFKMTPAGVYSILYNFYATDTDGWLPRSAPAIDVKGNLYGATEYGGKYGSGTIFKLTPLGRETILHSFDNNGVDGYLPFTGLTLDQKGNVWGSTTYGGKRGDGIIFEVSASGVYTIRLNFASVPTGVGYPESTITLDAAGNLYGTGTSYDVAWFGGVYKISHGSGEIWTEDVLTAFSSSTGSFPEAGITFDSAGNLYGTAFEGGTLGFGTVFELTPAGELISLFNFDGTHGSGPDNNLVLDSAGNLYGTTPYGGTGGTVNGGGTLYEITP
jgi:uncharacterized repeat protein (TIGR03803 family)